MASMIDGPTGTYVANAALSAFLGLTLSNNRGVGYSTTAIVPVAFTEEDAASGDYVAVRFFNASGTKKCQVTGCPVTVGDTLYAGLTGQVCTTGSIAVGQALTTAATNGTVIEFIPTY